MPQSFKGLKIYKVSCQPFNEYKNIAKLVVNAVYTVHIQLGIELFMEIL